MSVESRVLVKEGEEVEILGVKYIAAKPHYIVGVNLNEGKLKISSMKDGMLLVRDYSYKEIMESDLVKKKTIKETEGSRTCSDTRQSAPTTKEVIR